jgi:hypothetical protein
LGTPSGPLSGTRRAPHLALSGTPSGSLQVEKNIYFYFYFYFWLLLPVGKEGKKYFRFRFSIPKIPEFPELRGLCRRSREKKVFLA